MGQLFSSSEFYSQVSNLWHRPADQEGVSKRHAEDAIEKHIQGAQDMTHAELMAAARNTLLEKGLARERHPDVPGGSTEAMAELNAAKAAALRELGL